MIDIQDEKIFFEINDVECSTDLLGFVEWFEEHHGPQTITTDYFNPVDGHDTFSETFSTFEWISEEIQPVKLNAIFYGEYLKFPKTT